MIKSKFFLKYALVGSLIAVVFMLLSMGIVHWIREAAFERSFTATSGPNGFIERLISKLPADQRLNILENLEPRPRSGRKPPFCLTDSQGKILFPSNPHEEIKNSAPALTKQLAESPNLSELTENNLKVVRLSGEPQQFIVSFIRPPPPPDHGMFWLMTLTQLLVVILAVVLTIAGLVYGLRSRARLAEQVIQQLTHGNLQARFPISKMDEIGQVMFSFNKMADEIEHLIEHLRTSEATRKDLLRQLAHDLRTPIASMRSLMEIVKDKFDLLSPEKRKELLETALRETDYFSGLIDDLLFLGSVNEPNYQNNDEQVNISKLAKEELELLNSKYSSVQSQLICSPERIQFKGDQALLKRLMKNAFENAFSFAKSWVEVRVTQDQLNDLFIEVTDDGPGFSEQSLKEFGNRKFSRAMPEKGPKRITIGLGSVIMKSIAEAYRGSLDIKNLWNTKGEVAGAEVKIKLKRI